MSGPAFRLLVFDWDGTLLDSISTIVDCTQATLAELGLPAAPEKDIRSAIGLGIRETVESFCPGCDEDTFGRIVDVYRRLWFEHFSREPAVFSGVPALLEQLADEGRLLAVATAKSRRGLETDFARTGLAGHFQASRTVDEAASKPSPQMLLEILDELGARADESLMIGDAIHDLEMARNAGVSSIGITSGTTARETLEARGPLVCLEQAPALASWLDQNSAPLTAAADPKRIRP